MPVSAFVRCKDENAVRLEHGLSMPSLKEPWKCQFTRVAEKCYLER